MSPQGHACIPLLARRTVECTPGLLLVPPPSILHSHSSAEQGANSSCSDLQENTPFADFDPRQKQDVDIRRTFDQLDGHKKNKYLGVEIQPHIQSENTSLLLVVLKKKFFLLTYTNQGVYSFVNICQVQINFASPKKATASN